MNQNVLRIFEVIAQFTPAVMDLVSQIAKSINPIEDVTEEQFCYEQARANHVIKKLTQLSDVMGINTYMKTVTELKFRRDYLEQDLFDLTAVARGLTEQLEYFLDIEIRPFLCVQMMMMGIDYDDTTKALDDAVLANCNKTMEAFLATKLMSYAGLEMTAPNVELVCKPKKLIDDIVPDPDASDIVSQICNQTCKVLHKMMPDRKVAPAGVMRCEKEKEWVVDISDCFTLKPSSAGFLTSETNWDLIPTPDSKLPALLLRFEPLYLFRGYLSLYYDSIEDSTRKVYKENVWLKELVTTKRLSYRGIRSSFFKVKIVGTLRSNLVDIKDLIYVDQAMMIQPIFPNGHLTTFHHILLFDQDRVKLQDPNFGPSRIIETYLSPDSSALPDAIALMWDWFNRMMSRASKDITIYEPDKALARKYQNLGVPDGDFRNLMALGHKSEFLRKLNQKQINQLFHNLYYDVLIMKKNILRTREGVDSVQTVIHIQVRDYYKDALRSKVQALYYRKALTDMKSSLRFLAEHGSFG